MKSRFSLFARSCLVALLLVLMTAGHTLRAQDVITLSFSTYVPDIPFMQNTKGLVGCSRKKERRPHQD